MNLYFDNASTSFPKPNSVIKSINNFILNIGASPNRGHYESSIESSKIMFECREELGRLFNYKNSKNIVFTYNATYAFNLILNSLLNYDFLNNKPHILVSSLDHNSTIRPLINLKNKQKIELDFIKSKNNGFIDINDLRLKIRLNTKLVVISHMSNVLGTIQDLKEISEICSFKKIYLIIDGAQSAGLINIDLSSTYFSAFIFTGHKNLFSTQGIGGFIISDDLLDKCENFFLGGTGSESSKLLSKLNMPDYFEVGTQNIVGIASLLSGLKFIKEYNISNIFEHKKQIIRNIYNEIKNINDIIVLNDINNKNQNSIICLNFKNISPDEGGFILNKYFNINVRVGLHCSPNTHKLIGTFPKGCIRISPGIFNSSKDINFLIYSLNKINKGIF